MSAVTPTGGTYRLASPFTATTNLNATNNANTTFNTNIPSLDYAIRITRIRWLLNFPAPLRFTINAGGELQVFGQLTENQTKTVIASTDTSFLDEEFWEFTADYAQSSAVAISDLVMQRWGTQSSHYFYPEESPITVATKLNLVASVIVSSNVSAGSFGIQTQIEYRLERLTADLRDYLAKRLQIQGS